MNKTEIKITVKLSLKSNILSMLGVFTLAKKIPITVTDKSLILVEENLLQQKQKLQKLMIIH